MLTLEALASMWIASRGTAGCACAVCDAKHVALWVTEQREYRWTCVACGWRSDWFVIEKGSIRMIGRRNSMMLAAHAIEPLESGWATGRP
jgi:Zn ribbon nucleic-acid-binding protein